MKRRDDLRIGQTGHLAHSGWPSSSDLGLLGLKPGGRGLSNSPSEFPDEGSGRSIPGADSLGVCVWLGTNSACDPRRPGTSELVLDAFQTNSNTCSSSSTTKSSSTAST